MQVQEKYLHRFPKTHRHVTPHFLCPQVPKKSGQVQKTCAGPKNKKHASRFTAYLAGRTKKCGTCTAAGATQQAALKERARQFHDLWDPMLERNQWNNRWMHPNTQPWPQRREWTPAAFRCYSFLASGQKDSAYLFTCSVKLVVYRLWPMSTMRTILATALANWIARDSIPGYTRPFHHAWGASPAPLTQASPGSKRSRLAASVDPPGENLARRLHGDEAYFITMPIPSLMTPVWCRRRPRSYWRSVLPLEGENTHPCKWFRCNVAKQGAFSIHDKQLGSVAWGSTRHKTSSLFTQSLGHESTCFELDRDVSIKQVKQDFSLQNG